MSYDFEKQALEGAAAARKLARLEADAAVFDGLMLLRLAAVPLVGPILLNGALDLPQYVTSFVSDHVTRNREALLATPGGAELLELLKMQEHFIFSMIYALNKFAQDPHVACDAEGPKALLDDFEKGIGERMPEVTAHQRALVGRAKALLATLAQGRPAKPPAPPAAAT